MELIDPPQRAILQTFGQVLDSQEFYLTGGTALAYFYLKHRQSKDLDFFTPNGEIVVPFSRNLQKKLEATGFSVERRRGTQTFVELWTEREREGTVIHLAQDSAFRFESPKEFQAFPGLRVDSLVDIASNKLLALFGRAMLRDFVDVYFLIHKAGFRREGLVQDAAKKDPGFDLYWLGVALERIKTFREDSPEMLLLAEPIKFGDLLRFFDSWRIEIAKEINP